MPKTMILFGGLHSTETSLAKVSNSHWKPGHRGFEANVYSLNSTNKLIFSVVLPQWNCIGICHRIYSACAADQIAFSLYQSCLCFVAVPFFPFASDQLHISHSNGVFGFERTPLWLQTQFDWCGKSKNRTSFSCLQPGILHKSSIYVPFSFR